MPLVVLGVKIDRKQVPKDLRGKIPAITRQALRACAGAWHQNVLPRHFTPGNESRYRFDPRNALYMAEIKKEQGEGQGKYVKLLLKGKSQRWLRTFAHITATSHQAVLYMQGPTYFTQPFIGTTVDPETGRQKTITRQPDKPREVVETNDDDRRMLHRTFNDQVTLGMHLAHTAWRS
jgi:hypothetical protein